MPLEKEVLNIMQRTNRILSYTAVLLSFILTSCASTTMVSDWKDETYKGKIKKLLIMVIAEKPSSRRIFEREYVNQFKDYGITAIPSFNIIPADTVMDKETILSKIKGLDIDSVLVTSLVSTTTVTTLEPGWYGRYSYGYDRRFTDDIINLETTLHDVKSEKMIWSVVSETIIMEGENSLKKIRPFVETILKNLSKDKLI